MSTDPKNRKGDVGLYWTDYGGIHALSRSRYFRFSIVFTILSFALWSKEGWWENAISVVPAIIGFSLAAYAMLIAFANERFLKIITTPIPAKGEQDPKKTAPSVYLSTGAAFVHFIIVQTTALLLALACKALYVPVWHPVQKLLHLLGIPLDVFVWLTRSAWFVGYFVFIYGILCGLAATMRIYRMSRWYASMMQSDNSPSPENPA